MIDDDTDYTTIDEASVLRETDMAVLLYNGDINEEAWIPRSLIVDGDNLEVGLETSVEVASFKLAELCWI